MAMRTFSRLGGSTFTCHTCGHLTRTTTQSVGSECCSDCFELAGIENEISDGYRTQEEAQEDIDRYVGQILVKGGDPRKGFDAAFLGPNFGQIQEATMSKKATRSAKTAPAPKATAPRSRKAAPKVAPLTPAQVETVRQGVEEVLGKVAAPETAEPTAEENAQPSSNVVDAADAPVVSSSPVSEVPNAAPAAEPAATPEGGVKVTTLTLNHIRKNGSASYTIAGMVGSIRIAKAMFTGAPPATIEVASEGLKQPDAEKAAKMAAKAERKSKTASTREERAAKAKERAEKAQARAAKAVARAEKLAAKLAPKADAPAADAPAADAPATV